MPENRSESCTCKKKKCERYGKCSECIEYHKTNTRYPEPYCIRKAKKHQENR